MKPSFTIEGILILPAERKIIQGAIVINNGIVEAVVEKEVSNRKYIMPGLIDAHVHIESSMLVPSEFARAAVVHGTTATVSDPHEIANVLGTDGVEYMISNGSLTPFRFFFGAPSCVPATPLETSGAVLDSDDVLKLLRKEEVRYLAEMMNFPGVIFDDPQVKAKLDHAKVLGKPVDGHAPGLRGDQLKKYFESGISTDHECFTIDEAREKARFGMKILIREGSAARNFTELIPLIAEFPDQVMLCSDDKHPDDLQSGHINQLVRKGLEMGYRMIDLVRACTFNPVMHYNLNCGMLRKGDPADLIVVNNIEHFSVEETYISGVKVASFGKPLIASSDINRVNRFVATKILPDDIKVKSEDGDGLVKVIGALDGQIITKNLSFELPVQNGIVESDPCKDVLKIVAVNRYIKAPPAVGFIHGFGLKKGAMASSVAHDSHNIIATGTDDMLIVEAINTIMDSNGGLCALNESETLLLKLPVAGIMSDRSIDVVADSYMKVDAFAKKMGSTLTAPFMTLSFMALLVIPELKLGDKGLFDGLSFTFTKLFVK